MNRFISAACALFLVQQVAVALPAAAQSSKLVTQQQANVSTQTFAAATSGPTLAASRAGIALSTSQEKTVNSSAVDPHAGAGQDVALMVVGGAGLITGLVIGGNGGAAIAIGGAVVGLYGLYEYVK